MEIRFDIVAAERMIVELESAIDDGVEVERLLLGRSGTREFEKILDDAGGAAGLTMSHVELALGAFVDAGPIAE